MDKGSEGVGSGASALIEHSAKVRSLISFQVHWKPLEDAALCFFSVPGRQFSSPHSLSSLAWPGLACSEVYVTSA